jgi:hypothetical protein
VHQDERNFSGTIEFIKEPDAIHLCRSHVHTPRNLRNPSIAEKIVMENLVQSWHRRLIFCHHVITLSALYSVECGIARPICFVVLRFIKISNLLGCSIGRSAGLCSRTARLMSCRLRLSSNLH